MKKKANKHKPSVKENNKKRKNQYCWENYKINWSIWM